MIHFYLYGPSGSGKSTAGRLLADRLGLPFFDLDEAIETAAGSGIQEIFTRDGEAAFRGIERAELARLARQERSAVIALGGGALLDPTSRSLVEETGRVLCLQAEAGVLLDRLAADVVKRPLLAGDPAESMSKYLQNRAAHYDTFPLRMDTTGRSPAETAESAGRVFGAFRVSGMGQPYDVRVEAGILDRIPAMLGERGLGGPFALVADANTAGHAHRIAAALENGGDRSSVIRIEPGEQYKTIETAGSLWTAFLDVGLERGSTILAVGGGVIGDLAGFAAATFLRGIAWVAVPTSLLAMVDASLGGKTGADLPQGKNLVGAFHSPRLVAADPETLVTLPAGELRNGLAEMVKAGVIGDPELFERCAGWDGGIPGVEWISRAMAVKIRFIESDPFEAGLRAVLNFGHTVGHALEHVSGYHLAHGEAVAIGMAVETALAERLGLAEKGCSKRVADCLARIGLPFEIPPALDRERILEAMYRDKKVRAGRLRFALPSRIGAVEIVAAEAGDIRALLTL